MKKFAFLIVALWNRTKLRIWTLFSSGKEFLHIVIDMINIFRINTFTFIVPCAQMQFKGPSIEIGRLLSNRLSNVSHKLETSNVKAGLKKCFFLKKKSVYCFFAVNTEYLIEHQM